MRDALLDAEGGTLMIIVLGISSILFASDPPPRRSGTREGHSWLWQTRGLTEASTVKKSPLVEIACWNHSACHPDKVISVLSTIQFKCP